MAVCLQRPREDAYCPAGQGLHKLREHYSPMTPICFANLSTGLAQPYAKPYQIVETGLSLHVSPSFNNFDPGILAAHG